MISDLEDSTEGRNLLKTSTSDSILMQHNRLMCKLFFFLVAMLSCKISKKLGISEGSIIKMQIFQKRHVGNALFMS